MKKIREEMCENYCKYASEIFDIEQEQLEEICNKCPMNGLNMEDCFDEKKNY